jgi:hypothetical protein
MYFPAGKKDGKEVGTYEKRRLIINNAGAGLFTTGSLRSAGNCHKCSQHDRSAVGDQYY